MIGALFLAAALALPPNGEVWKDADGRERTVRLNEIPVHAKAGQSVVVAELGEDHERFPEPDPLLTTWSGADSDDLRFAWRKACATPTAKAFAAFDTPEARLNEARCLLLAGKWAEAMKIYNRLEWRTGQTPAIDADGNFFACCCFGNSSVNPPQRIAYVGNSNDTPLPRLLEAMEHDLLLNLFGQLGPYAVARLLQARDPALPFSGDYTTNCDICRELYGIPEIRQSVETAGRCGGRLELVQRIYGAGSHGHPDEHSSGAERAPRGRTSSGPCLECREHRSPALADALVPRGRCVSHGSRGLVVGKPVWGLCNGRG
mgnify:CR=1 FL=1